MLRTPKTPRTPPNNRNNRVTATHRQRTIVIELPHAVWDVLDRVCADTESSMRAVASGVIEEALAPAVAASSAVNAANVECRKGKAA